MEKIERLISLLGKGVMLIDGAYGTELLTSGQLRYSKIPDMLTLESPDRVGCLHTEYLEAGADIIKTNSFNSNTCVLQGFGLEGIADSLAFKSSALARKMVDEYMDKHPNSKKFVAASIFLLGLYGKFEKKQLTESYKSTIGAHIEGGADIILFETVTSLTALIIGLDAVREVEWESGTKIPVIVSYTPSQEGKLLSGETMAEFVAIAEKYDVLAVGINCGNGSDCLGNYIRQLSKLTEKPILAAPNAGIPDKGGEYHDSPVQFALNMEEMIKEGLISIAGGCCGTTPAYIRRLKSVVEKYCI